MTKPAVTITQLDNALGVLPPSAGRLLAVVGGASKGPTDTPATYARVKDLVADFGDGPGVELAAAYIARWARPVLFVRLAIADDGSVGSVTHTGTGTSVGTMDVASAPVDDYDLIVRFTVGGTKGEAGAVYEVSLDGGYNWEPSTALGTAAAITVRGITLDLGTGTFVAGDTYAVRSAAPVATSSEVQAALTALGNSAVAWEQCLIAGPMDATIMGAVETKFAALAAAGKPRSWIGQVRVPNVAESESAYLTAMTTEWGSVSAVYGSLCAGAGNAISGVSGRNYRRSLLFAFGALQGGLSEEQNAADVNVGALTGFIVRDVNGNPLEHDESINPGLDDLRLVTAYTDEAIQGVYITRPRIFAADGSDFYIIPHRRVLNLAHGALRAYFARRLNKPILVSAATGFILETEALEIEAGARAAMGGVLLAKPKASAVLFALSRTDNILSTKTLTGQGRVVPLAYPEWINLDLGFYNPALQITQVAA